MPGAFAAAHCLKRSSLLGPLMGKVQLHLKVMIMISNLSRAIVRILSQEGAVARMMRWGSKTWRRSCTCR